MSNKNQNKQKLSKVSPMGSQEQEMQKLNLGSVGNEIANQKWFTEAYEDFKTRLCTDYLVVNDVTSKFQELIKKLDMKEGNSSNTGTDCACLCSHVFSFLICPIVWWCTRTVFNVPNNSFAFVIEEADDGRKTQIYGPGYHILGYYNKLQGIYSFDRQYQHNIIESDVGDLKIATVNQGNIMHLECGGQNIILGPGIHKITEPMTFIQLVSLDSFYIEIGPEKFVTIPDGYDGISLNRGKINILKGGKQHHLQHVGDKFAKMVPKTLQTDRVPSNIPQYVQRLEDGSMRQEKRQQNDPSEYLEATTAEGATVILDAMIFWKIIDTSIAASTAMEILKVDGMGEDDIKDESKAIKASSKNITILRQNVLRYCKDVLTSLVGTCSLAGKQQMQTQIKKPVPKNMIQEDDERSHDELAEKVGNINPTSSNVARNQYFSGENQNQNQPPFEQQNFVNDTEISQIHDENQNLIEDQKIKQISMSRQQQLPSIGQHKKTKNQIQKQQKQQQQQAKIEIDTSNDNTFAILSFLQNSAYNLKDHINEKLMEIGCHLENICIYSVIPTREIQTELDRQTKAKVDANTAIIKAMAKKEASEITQEVQNAIALKQAKSNAEVRSIRAQSEADSKMTLANGEAESIRTIARARKQEAEEIESVQIATDLAQIRVTGEAGQKIFSGKQNTFVFGQNPGDSIHQMMVQKLK